MASRSPRRFLERSGLINTQRLPSSRMAIGNLASIRYPLKPPYPPEHNRPNEGDIPPDRGVSREWPFGII
jgi:hypothetical protein